MGQSGPSAAGTLACHSGKIQIDGCAQGRNKRLGSVAGGVAMLTILIIVVIILAIGSAPAWPYSRGWGYYPSGLLGLILLILIILALTGRL
jgi:Protein of unknown function (DUF3309)